MLRNKILLLPLGVLLLAAGFSPLQAVPPFPGGIRPEGPTCFVNGQASLRRLEALRKFAPGFAPPISSTTYKLAVLRIDFPDKAMSKTKAETETFFNYVKAFYAENSYGILTVNATVTDGGTGTNGAFRLLKNHTGYYANGLSSRYSELVSDGIARATATFDFSTYDHIMVYHAGEGAETASISSDYIWSAYAPSSLVGGPVASGKSFPGVTFVPESEFVEVDPLGVICHEYGHQLGLPDLYSTTTGGSQVGKWSLMDNGIYIGSPKKGSNPPHLDAWSKLFLGFSSPETISYTEGQLVSLSPAETTRGAFIRLPVSVSDVGADKEYFLLEYRATSAGTYDTALPTQGLLVWHIDDSIASSANRIASNDVNTNPSRRGVDLVEADSTDSSNGGGTGEPFPGSGGETHFKATKSNAYNGSESGVEVFSIAGAGAAAMTMTVRTPFNNPALARNAQPGKLVITGGAKGYINPAKGESVLFGVTPTSGERINLKVYTLKGDLVFETSFSGSANQQTIKPWNGKNSDGTTVASGIYIVHISGGGMDVIKKFAVAK